MRNIFPLFAIVMAVFALTLTIKLGKSVDDVRAIRAERDQLMKSYATTCSDADRQYAQNARLRAALEAAGYEIPEELKPTLPNGELIASN